MATSTLAQILTRLAAVLQANAPTGTKLFTDRVEAESLAETPSINTLVHQVTRQPHGAGVDQCEAEIELVFGIRADACTVVAETLHAAVHGPLVTDAALLQLADSVLLFDETFDRQEADTPSLLKKAKYRFVFSAPRNQL